ncbi:hypothetical protein MU471_14220, partial [Staphylococcus aureus]|nr:hypothetical protein [Staphylococcus aureus]
MYKNNHANHSNHLENHDLDNFSKTGYSNSRLDAHTAVSYTHLKKKKKKQKQYPHESNTELLARHHTNPQTARVKTP